MEASSQATTGRREAILDATIRLLSRHGPAGVTHRAVAAQAGVPLAATTYYFASKEELLGEALRRMAAEEVARLEAAREALGAGLEPAGVAAAIARVLAAQFGGGPDALAKFEVYLHAARGGPLRGEARAAICAFAGLAGELLEAWGVEDPAAAAAVFVGAVDGLVLHALVEDGTIDARALAERLERLLGALAG